MSKISILLRGFAAIGLVSLAACAGANDRAAYGNGTHAQLVDALRTSNESAYSNPAFRAEPRPGYERDGFSGSSEPAAPPVLWTGTENFPPEVNGAEAPGGQASGSTLGQAGD